MDNMSDEANLNYGAQPDRLYIIKNGKIDYLSDKGPFGYDLKGVEKWIKQYLGNQ